MVNSGKYKDMNQSETYQFEYPKYNLNINKAVCNTTEQIADNPTDDDVFKISFAKQNYNFDIFNNPECWGLADPEDARAGGNTEKIIYNKGLVAIIGNFTVGSAEETFFNKFKTDFVNDVIPKE